MISHADKLLKKICSILLDDNTLHDDEILKVHVKPLFLYDLKSANDQR